MTIVIVGFKVGEENSTFYKKVKVENLADPQLGQAMAKALEVSHFVSVRKVDGVLSA